MDDKKADVYADNTVSKNKKRGTAAPILQPGPPDSGEPDFEPDKKPRSPGFATVAGAGPNPTQPD
jgi:hypothetical protein